MQFNIIMRHLFVVCSVLVVFLFMTGCWKENLSNCWQGEVVINVSAEKFQNTKNDIEEVFSKRVRTLHYFLYRDSILVEDSIISDCEKLLSSVYPLKWQKLPFGKYSLLLFANTESDQVLVGDVNNPASLKIVYPGIEKTKDYFVSRNEFTLDCDCGYLGNVVMERAHGVVQYNLKNIPDNITEIEVIMDQLGSVCGVPNLMIYKSPLTLTYRTPTDPFSTEGKCSFTLGTFPTPSGSLTTLNLKLFADHDPEHVVYNGIICDTAFVERNQLLRVTTTFPENGILENVRFGIEVNPRWDGSHGGDVEVQ